MAEHWLRLWHGTATDPKFRMVARDASAMSRDVTPCHAVLSVWMYLLECASQNNPRGSIDGLDVEVMAFTLDMETGMAEAIVEAMKKRGLIDDNSLSGWEKRQPKREDEGATERKRKSREAAKSHAASRTVTTEEKRGEESRGEEKDQERPTDLSPAGAGDEHPANVSRLDSIPYQPLADLYNEICGDLFPQVSKLTDKRRKAIKSRWLADTTAADERKRTNSLDYWRRYFTFCRGGIEFFRKAASGEHTGSHGGWRPDFDFLMTERAWLGVREGKYQ